ncbi:MAG: hypothetical protein QM820_13340 [Minicystis sp.]
MEPSRISLRKSGTFDLVFRAADPADAAAANTAEELDRIHNGTDSAATEKAAALRLSIIDHVTAVTQEAFRYLTLATGPSAASAEAVERRDRVKKLVSRRAPYAMLVRSYLSPLDAIRALFD